MSFHYVIESYRYKFNCPFFELHEAIYDVFDIVDRKIHLFAFDTIDSIEVFNMEKCIIISQDERIALCVLLTESIKKLDDKSFSLFRLDLVNEIKFHYKSVLSKLEEAFIG